MKKVLKILIACTLTWGVAFTVNYTLHGPHCWGMHPGGPFNMWLFSTLRILTALSFAMGLYAAFSRRAILWVIPMVFIAIWFIYLYLIWWKCTGSRIFTSIHNQGAENLQGVFLLLGILTTSQITGLIIGKKGNGAQPGVAAYRR